MTNGPLLRVRANSQWPGAVFKKEDGALELKLEIELTTKDRVRAIEVIHNGAVTKKIPCADQLHQKLQAIVKIKAGGWILLRAITNKKTTFHFASIAPFYIDTDKPSISRRSAQFFLDWVKQRQARVPNKLKDPAKLRKVLAHHQHAQKFWEHKLSQANAYRLKLDHAACWNGSFFCDRSAPHPI